MTKPEGPLNGIRIVEFAGIGAGPHAAMMLADMGADVICIDRISSADLGVAIDPKYDFVRRGRRSIAIDIKKEEGRKTVLRLVERADAVIESFRPGVMERLGMGPDVCLHRQPRLVYGRMTGWGQHGPNAERAGHDINYIALTGVLHAIGSRGGPPIPPLNLVGDFGGAAYFAFGIVCALLVARRSGRGQVVDGAMVDCAAALFTMIVGFDRAGVWSNERGNNILDGGAPFYRTYETADRKYVAIGAVERKFYDLLLGELGLASDPDMHPHTDRAKWPLQSKKIAAEIAKLTRDQWCARLETSDACFAPVLSLEEVPDHPHIKARQTFIDVGNFNQPAPAPRFSVTIPPMPRQPCAPGEHSRSALLDWNFPVDEVDRLIRSEIVAQRQVDDTQP
jgi:alpha-methylacyl-CoA racemase